MNCFISKFAGDAPANQGEQSVVKFTLAVSQTDIDGVIRMSNLNRQQVVQILLDRKRKKEEMSDQVEGFYSKKIIEEQSPVNFSQEDLSYLDLSNLDFTDAIMIGTNLTGANLQDAILDGTKLDKAKLDGANLTGTSFMFASLRDVDISKVDPHIFLFLPYLNGFDLEKINLIASDFNNVNWQKGDLSGLNLSKANFDGANLNEALLERTILGGASFKQATLAEASLQAADLSGANLSEADLSGADLQEANLADTNLDQADLSNYTNLSKATLLNASLINANLTNASLYGADLRRANLRGADLSEAEYDSATKWPDAFNPDAAGAIYCESEDENQNSVSEISEYDEVKRTGENEPALILNLGSAIKVQMSQVNSTLITGSDYGSIQFWELSTAYNYMTLPNSTGKNTLFAISPNGKLVASPSQNFSIKLWDTVTGQELGFLNGHTCQVMAATFSPDGQFLASIDVDSFIRIWDVSSGTEFRVIKTLCWGGFRLSFCQDNQILAVPGISGTKGVVVNIWNINEAHIIKEISGFENGISSLNYSNEDKLLVISGYSGEVKLFSFITDEQKILATSVGSVYTTAFHLFGHYLALGMRLSGGDKIKILDLRNGSTIKYLSSPVFGSINSISFSSDGKRIAAGFGSFAVVWNL